MLRLCPLLVNGWFRWYIFACVNSDSPEGPYFRWDATYAISDVSLASRICCEDISGSEN